jgi:hypothetical protein
MRLCRGGFCDVERGDELGAVQDILSDQWGGTPQKTQARLSMEPSHPLQPIWTKGLCCEGGTRRVIESWNAVDLYLDSYTAQLWDSAQVEKTKQKSIL